MSDFRSNPINENKIEYDFSDEEFVRKMDRNNAIKSYIVCWIAFYFALAMFVVDVFRYISGELTPGHARYYVNCINLACHITFFLCIIPARAVKKNMERVTDGSYPYTRRIFSINLAMTAIPLLLMGLTSIIARNNIIAVLVYVMFCNHFFSMSLPRRVFLNVLGFIALVIGVFINDGSISDTYISLVEGAGIIVPSNFIAHVQMRMRYENFLINKKLQNQNQIILESNKALMGKSLQGQMNPHFIFNTLNSIQHFMLSKDQKSSMAYLSKFARLIRLIFQYSNKNTISLENEIDFLKLYLYLEELRFEQKVKVELNIADSLTFRSYDVLIPPLIIQPLIENAFKHGLMHKKENGVLEIDLYKEGHNLICVVRDNGVGRRKSIEYVDDLSINKRKGKDNNKQDRHSALDIIYQRLGLLNDLMPKDHGNPNSLVIKDLTDRDGKACGTEVRLSLSLDNHQYLQESDNYEQNSLDDISRV